MEEAQTLCDRVAVMDAGKIIAMDSPDALIRRHFAETALEFADEGAVPNAEVLTALAGVTRCQQAGKMITLFTEDTTATLTALTHLGESGSFGFEDLHVRRATLEDVFLEITGRRIRD